MAQLNRLRSGLHPVTKIRLAAPVRLDGTPIGLSTGYANLRAAVSDQMNPDFKPYVPEEPPSRPSRVSEHGGNTAKEKARLRHTLVRFRERRARVRGQQVQLNELIDSFISNCQPGLGSQDAVEQMDRGDDSDEDFWNSLDCVNGPHHECPKLAVSMKPDPGWGRGMIHSRLSRLAPG